MQSGDSAGGGAPHKVHLRFVEARHEVEQLLAEAARHRGLVLALEIALRKPTRLRTISHSRQTPADTLRAADTDGEQLPHGGHGDVRKQRRAESARGEGVRGRRACTYGRSDLHTAALLASRACTRSTLMVSRFLSRKPLQSYVTGPA